MPYKPVPTDKFRKFLKYINCVCEGVHKHEKWSRSDLLRPIIFRPSEKEIPASHIRTNLITLGMSWKEFEEIFKKL